MLKEQGIALIYISHKMDEIFEICDQVSVLRDGNLVMTKDSKDTNMGELIHRHGWPFAGKPLPAGEQYPGDTILSVQHLSTKYAPYLQDISFDVREGEIFGLYGLVGAGRTELLETIFGVRTRAAGRVYFRDHLMNFNNCPRSDRAWICPDYRGTQGKRPVPEERFDIQYYHCQTGPVQRWPWAVNAQNGKSHKQGDQGHAHQVHGT